MGTELEQEADLTLGVLEQLVGYHLRRASTVVGNDFTRAMAGTGMRQVLFGALSVVAANPDINQGSVGKMLGIQRANMVSLINELVDAGWVARRVAAEDRRAFALSITSDGTEALDSALERIRDHEKRVLSELGPKQMQQLIGLLQRIESKER